jgi:hypothetical protein
MVVIRSSYTRNTKIVLLALLAALVYAGVAFWPPVKTYFHVKEDTRRLANRLLSGQEDLEQAVEKLMAGIQARDKLLLTRGDVVVEVTEEAVNIRVRLLLPYRFPFVEEQRTWHVTAETRAEKARGF